MAERKCTLSVLVENTPGALARIAGLFSGRGFNIDSLCVAETLDPTLSHLTLVTRGDEQIIEQIIKQLRRLIDVYKVVDVTEEETMLKGKWLLSKSELKEKIEKKFTVYVKFLD